MSQKYVWENQPVICYQHYHWYWKYLAYEQEFNGHVFIALKQTAVLGFIYTENHPNKHQRSVYKINLEDVKD